ncbi:non-histone chromosomal protein 6 [Cryptococcus depauperatus CBS 7841]|uniref:Non-histone chromosomal protein 6 n=1 Tax=Cryptococcus depauperatus CBS 7841 TaxID=1295531 RepID=A0AAJ8M296_9TREE
MSHLYTMPKVSSKDSKKSAAEPKKRGSKKDKDPNKPKRALSAYMFFVQDYRERIKTENPEASFGDVGKLLGIKWKEMSDVEKKPYNDKAKADKERADKQNADYKADGKSKKSAAKDEESDEDDE